MGQSRQLLSWRGFAAGGLHNEDKVDAPTPIGIILGGGTIFFTLLLLLLLHCYSYISSPRVLWICISVLFQDVFSVLGIMQK